MTSTRSVVLHLALIAALFAIQYVLPPYHYGNLARIMLYAVFAIGYNVLLGYTGLLSLGHALFFAAGAYGAGLTVFWFQLNPVGALGVGVLSALVASMLVGLVVYRATGVAFLIITLMLAQAGLLTSLYFNSITYGDQGLVLTVAPVEFLGWKLVLSDPSVRYNLALAVFALILILSLWLKESPFGRVLIAIRENETKTALLGYNTPAFRFWALVISGTITGLAGALYCLLFSYVGSSFVSLQYSTLPLIWTLMGGTGSTFGPFVGAAAMYYLIDLSSDYTASYMIVVGIALVTITLWFPTGIAGFVSALFKRTRK